MASKKRWSRIALILLITLVGGIIFLELGSRWYYKDDLEVFSLPPAAVCDPAQYPPDPARLAALEDLLDIRHQGRRITPQELEDVLVEAPQEDMPGMNGVFCSGMVIVSKRLSPSARLYVARHELEHYFQIEGTGWRLPGLGAVRHLGGGPGISLGFYHHHQLLLVGIRPQHLYLEFPVWFLGNI